MHCGALRFSTLDWIVRAMPSSLLSRSLVAVARWSRVENDHETKKMSPRPTTENSAIRRTRLRAPCRMLDSGQTSSTVQPLPAWPEITTVSLAFGASAGAGTSGLPCWEERTA